MVMVWSSVLLTVFSNVFGDCEDLSITSSSSFMDTVEEAGCGVIFVTCTLISIGTVSITRSSPFHESAHVDGNGVKLRSPGFLYMTV